MKVHDRMILISLLLVFIYYLLFMTWTPALGENFKPFQSFFSLLIIQSILLAKLYTTRKNTTTLILFLLLIFTPLTYYEITDMKEATTLTIIDGQCIYGMRGLLSHLTAILYHIASMALVFAYTSQWIPENKQQTRNRKYLKALLFTLTLFLIWYLTLSTLNIHLASGQECQTTIMYI